MLDFSCLRKRDENFGVHLKVVGVKKRFRLRADTSATADPMTHEGGGIQMASQEILTMSQIIHKQGNGRAQIATNNGVIQPGTHSFADQNALNAYVVETFGAKVQGGGVCGSISRKGAYVRRSADGTPMVTFGDPVLDAIASANGSIVIGGRTIDLTPLRAGANALAGGSGPGAGAVVFDMPALKYRGIVNGAEKWSTDDNSYVEYRIGNGRLGFQAWRNGPSFADVGLWEMGILISVWNTYFNYEAALIEAIDYMSLVAPCRQHSAGQNTDYNGNHIDLTEYGSPLTYQPERVVGLCMARWHHREFRDVVTAGSGCPAGVDLFSRVTFPADWTPIGTEVSLNGNWTDGSSRNAVISVRRRTLSIDMSAFGRPAASGTVDGYEQIKADFPDDRSYTGQLVGNSIHWSNGSQWQKIINTAFDLNGSWTDGSPWVAVIFAGPVSLTIDMSDFERPNANGKIIDSFSITATFPDDHAYTGTLIARNTIRWSNGSTWTKKGV